MPGRLDLTGKQFDELTVVEMLYNYKNKHRTYCRCLGVDGKYYTVRQDALQSGATHRIQGAMSGGQQHDITGQRFGKLTALYPIEERATNGGVKWACICDCGEMAYPTMNNLKRGHTLSCGCRKDSKWENFIRDYLEKNKIKFVPQKMFTDCWNKAGNCHLYFDFYLPDYNHIIEYDGLQHFEPVPIWGGEERFIHRQENDEIKNEYCRVNNIKLTRIPYYKKEAEVIQIIDNIIHPVTIIA